MSDLGPAEQAALLAFADDEHLMGQRHTEWIGVAPFLEEDLAFSSIAQDELGHAVLLYEIIGESAGAAGGGTVDDLAFGRTAVAYRSCWLVEEPCSEWSEALVRHWLYDIAEQLRWEQLALSTDPRVRAVAVRALSEEVYHRRHAEAILDALADDPEARRRLDDAFERLLPLAVALFEPIDGAGDADRAIVGAPVEELYEAWCAEISKRRPGIDWAAMASRSPTADGRRHRSRHFDEVYARMCEVVDLDRSASW